MRLFFIFFLFFAQISFAEEEFIFEELDLGILPKNTIVNYNLNFDYSIKNIFSFCECLKANFSCQEKNCLVKLELDTTGYIGENTIELIIFKEFLPPLKLKIKFFVE